MFTQKPIDPVRKATDAAGRILELTAFPSREETFGDLTNLLPGFTFDGRESDLRFSVQSAVALTVRRGHCPSASRSQRSIADRAVTGLEALLDELRTSSRFSSALPISDACSLMGPNFLGPEIYERCLEEGLSSPTPFPAGLTSQLLTSRCPFEPGREVRETHGLAYLAPLSIIEFCNPVEKLTRDWLDPSLPAKPPFYQHEAFARLAPFDGKWALVYNGTLPGSTQCTFEQQLSRLDQYPEYQAAGARELSMTLALGFLAWGHRNFEKFGRTSDETFDRQQVHVQLNATNGLVIDRAPPSDARPNIGLAISRRLYVVKY